jgi:acyl-CoA thioesterase FadM
MTLSHRPTREGVAVTEAHVPAYLALEVATTAFADALPHVTDGLLQATDVVIAHLEASFSRELLVGNVDVNVLLRKVGRTSLGIEVALEQNGVVAGSITLVLVHVVDGRSAPIPSELRAILVELIQ